MKLNRTNNVVLVYGGNNAGSFDSHAWIQCVVLNHIRLGFVNFDTFIKHKHIRKDEKNIYKRIFIKIFIY